MPTSDTPPQQIAMQADLDATLARLSWAPSGVSLGWTWHTWVSRAGDLPGWLMAAAWVAPSSDGQGTFRGGTVRVFVPVGGEAAFVLEAARFAMCYGVVHELREGVLLDGRPWMQPHPRTARPAPLRRPRQTAVNTCSWCDCEGHNLGQCEGPKRLGEATRHDFALRGRLLALLSTAQRDVVLRLMAGTAPAEIALERGCARPVVSVLARRAARRMSECLEFLEYLGPFTTP